MQLSNQMKIDFFFFKLLKSSIIGYVLNVAAKEFSIISLYVQKYSNKKTNYYCYHFFSSS